MRESEFESRRSHKIYSYEYTSFKLYSRSKKGSFGWYCDFDSNELHQDHWKIVGLIAEQYNILNHPCDPYSGINWELLFNRVQFEEVNYNDYRFPEFKSIMDLRRFVSLLNTNVHVDNNFIDMEPLLWEVVN